MNRRILDKKEIWVDAWVKYGKQDEKIYEEDFPIKKLFEIGNQLVIYFQRDDNSAGRATIF
jgi:hypothetical protein